MAPSERRINGFDGLRALAFLMVFVSHKAPSPRTEALGTTGVWLFFVLSGFLIVRILAAARTAVEAGASTPLGSLGLFYRNRLVRCYLGALSRSTHLARPCPARRCTKSSRTWRCL